MNLNGGYMTDPPDLMSIAYEKFCAAKTAVKGEREGTVSLDHAGVGLTLAAGSAIPTACMPCAMSHVVALYLS